jgi:hypothetical protein
MIPRMISPISEPVFANVNTFWTILPRLRPRVFIQVSNAIIRIPRSWAVESENA